MKRESIYNVSLKNMNDLKKYFDNLYESIGNDLIIKNCVVKSSNNFDFSCQFKKSKKIKYMFSKIIKEMLASEIENFQIKHILIESDNAINELTLKITDFIDFSIIINVKFMTYQLYNKYIAEFKKEKYSQNVKLLILKEKLLHDKYISTIEVIKLFKVKYVKYLNYLILNKKNSWITNAKTLKLLKVGEYLTDSLNKRYNFAMDTKEFSYKYIDRNNVSICFNGEEIKRICKKSIITYEIC